jgi:HEAT repeat protein
VEVLAKLLPASDVEADRTTLAILDALGPDGAGDRTLLVLVDSLGPERVPLALLFQAIDTFGELGPRARLAIPCLQDMENARSNYPPELRRYAAQALNRIGDLVQEEHLEIFLKIFTDAERKVHTRAHAGWSLGRYASPKSELPIGPLHGLLREQNFKLRRLAVLALAKLGPRARETVPAVARRVLEDDDMSVRLNAVIALQTLGKEDPHAAVPALEKALQRPEVEFRRPAAQALANIGPGAAPAVPSLAVGLKDADAQVRLGCAAALGNIGQAAAPAVMPLTAAAYSPDVALREQAIIALGNIGPAAGDGVPALLFCMRQSRQLDFRTFSKLFGAAVNALAKVGEPARRRIMNMEVLRRGDDPWEVTGVLLAISKSSMSREKAQNYLMHIDRYLRPAINRLRQDAPETRELRRLMNEAIVELKIKAGQ